MKDLIKYEDFGKLDIRAGKVIEASLPDWSEKLLRYVVYFGEEIGKRVLFSGIRNWYKPEDVIGKTIPVIINLEPKKMGDEYSQGMTVMVDGSERPTMIFMSDDIKPGDVIR